MIVRDPAETALLLVDMQNDFLHPQGAYARGGVVSPALAALPDALAPVADAARAADVWVVTTHFTLVPGRHGEPFISPHLQQLRPFLKQGDFAPGSFGHALIDALSPADLSVEKIAYSAFYMSRLEWVLRRAGTTHLVVGGIVTNGGVASTVREAHVRDFRISVLEDGCAAFDEQLHDDNIAALRGIAEIVSCADFMQALATA
jgi:nicotinamidase-related amidase